MIEQKQKEAFAQKNLDNGHEPSTAPASSIPFNNLQDVETFGMLVRTDKPSGKIKVIEREDFLKGDYTGLGGPEPTTRFLPGTEEGRFDNHEVQLSDEIAKAIRNNIIRLYPRINDLRVVAATMYAEMGSLDLVPAPRLRMEADAHIATVFLQNYASVYRALSELKARVESVPGAVFLPAKVLDVGYGPATGMIALNALLGDDFYPEVKHSLIEGNYRGCKTMRDRAKILLSRQLNEVAVEKYSPEQQREITKEVEQEDLLKLTKEQKRQRKYEEEDSNMGPVDTNRIKIRTKLINEMLATRKYDLIIVSYQMLKDSENFPYGIDDAVQKYLNALEPKGHLVLIERGNPTGFEVLARARQIMIRPENYSQYEYGKLPRPWIRGSSVKPQRNVAVPEAKVSEEDKLLEKHLEEKFGAPLAQDLELEPELKGEYEVVGENKEGIFSDFYLKVVAPYTHHFKCALQMGHPKYYEYPKGLRLEFLSFNTSVARPKYTLEFKRGAMLSGKWESPTIRRAQKGVVTGGSGRPDGKNSENVNFNFLIVQRTRSDHSYIRWLEKERKRVQAVAEEIESAKDPEVKQQLIESEKQRVLENHGDESDQWARILKAPIKNKGHVIFQVMTSEGKIEKWIVPKSFGAGVYHDARKAFKGDLWKHGAKTKLPFFDSEYRQADKYRETFKNYERLQKRLGKAKKSQEKKEQRLQARQLELQKAREYEEEFYSQQL